MLRKRTSHLLGAGKSPKTTQPQSLSAPARTLRLHSPMSGSVTELNETSQIHEFDFGLEASKHDHVPHTEPLFNDTFYLSSEDDASPLSPEAATSPAWTSQRPSITVSPAEEYHPFRISDMELDTLSDDILIATTITYTVASKISFFEITMKRSRENSRTSSISTHNTLFSTHNDQHSSILSTPASSIYDLPCHSPSAPSSPDIDNKPFRKALKRNVTTSLDSIEERPREHIPQMPLIRTPTFKRKDKSSVQVKTAEIMSSTDEYRPATPNTLRRSKKSIADVWHRR